MILYLDASAIVKQFIEEPGSQEIITVLQQAENIGTSIITKTETVAAISKSVRLGIVHQNIAVGLVQIFYQQWRQFFRVKLNEMLVARASTIAWDLGLRGYDAVHLSAALIWQESINTQVKMVTFDKQLWNATKKRGLAVLPHDLNAFLETADPDFF